MNIASLQSGPVRAALEAINQGNLEEFMALFVPDARVIDVSTYKGHQSIRQWAVRETFNTKVRFELTGVTNPEGTIVTGDVSSEGGYNGPAVFTFTLRGNQIERLVIE